MHKSRLGEYQYHLCQKCWHTTKPENTDDETCECRVCRGTAERMVVRPISIDPQGIFKCGGKDSLSTWEEIYHRPKPGQAGF